MKEFVGVVVSNKGTQTAVVKIERMTVHPKYKKRFIRSRKFKAHDLLGVAIGDRVRIVEIAPVSKDKHFKVKEIVK